MLRVEDKSDNGQGNHNDEGNNDAGDGRGVESLVVVAAGAALRLGFAVVAVFVAGGSGGAIGGDIGDVAVARRGTVVVAAADVAATNCCRWICARRWAVLWRALSS